MAVDSAILYQNDAKNVTLIDMPKSIALAQGISNISRSSQLYSGPAIREPYLSTEPKSEKARLKVRKSQDPATDHALLSLLKDALGDIATHWRGPWCLDRHQRLKIEEKRPSKGDEKFAEPQLVWDDFQTWRFQESFDLSLVSESSISVQRLSDRVVRNPSSSTISLMIGCENQIHYIPPASGFMLAKINASTAPNFSMSALAQLPGCTNTAEAGQFDFILLDPPWPNRSVRRSKTYGTDEDPVAALLPVLEQHLAPTGWVACWITNKSSVRKEALGYFDTWGIELVEEWIWLKVTLDGRPVTELDGIWRKPYETLLLGKRRGQREEIPQIERRIIVAVPDEHSRKPHLKELIHLKLPGSGPHRMLEIFARNLTSEWWAWGDEVLKFNWQGWWTDLDHAED